MFYSKVHETILGDKEEQSIRSTDTQYSKSDDAYADRIFPPSDRGMVYDFCLFISVYRYRTIVNNKNHCHLLKNQSISNNIIMIVSSSVRTVFDLEV